jgi:hypothetical protein
MATLSWFPSVGFTLTLPSGNVAARVDDITYGPNAQWPEANCHTVIVYNMDGASQCLVKFDDINSFAGPAMVADNSTVIAPGSSISIGMGSTPVRSDMGAPQNELGLWFKSLALAGNILVNITFVYGRGATLL